MAAIFGHVWTSLDRSAFLSASRGICTCYVLAGRGIKAQGTQFITSFAPDSNEVYAITTE